MADSLAVLLTVPQTRALLAATRAQVEAALAELDAAEREDGQPRRVPQPLQTLMRAEDRLRHAVWAAEAHDWSAE